ncbi:MAG: hypothetical protein ABFR02_00255 [Campylobacterota bacterium]
MSELFANYANFILFVHVFAALFWVGGMLAIRLAVHPALQHIEDPKIRLARTLEILKNFFSYVIFMIILLLASAVIMAVGLGFKGTPLYSIVLVKEAIWAIMVIVFIIIYIRRNQAEKLFIGGDLGGAKQKLAPIATYLIPINIALGIAALYFGGILRGF